MAVLQLENHLSPEVFWGRQSVDIITDQQDQGLLQFSIIKSSSTEFSVLLRSKNNWTSSSCSYKTTSAMERFRLRI